MQKTVLLIATFDTKQDEAFFLKECIEAQGMRVLTLDTGILAPPAVPVDIPQTEVAQRGGTPLHEAVAGGDKGACIVNMIRGVEALAADLFAGDRFHGIIGIGGGQGTDIGCAAMRVLPFGVPKLMVSTVASGRATFGPFVGTRDVTLMHSVADMQGLNFLTKRILQNAAGAICGMVRDYHPAEPPPVGVPVALSMLGTTTPGALRCKKILENQGFEVVAFHQNGTGGIAMEDMLRAGAFQGVLDLALHEIGDRFLNGLHGAIRDDRLEAAGAVGVPQIVAPGSINYVVLGPLDTLSPAMRARKLIVHNTYLTLVRLTADELHGVGRLVAAKLNRAKGPTRVFIPLRGFSFPDRENLAHWDPEGNQAFLDALKTDLTPTIPLIELDAHINDPEFIDPVIEEFLRMMGRFTGTYAEREAAMAKCLENRNAIVTGAARGMGFSIAQALYAEGARVVLLDVDGPVAAEAARSLDAEGAGAVGRQVDVRNKDEIQALAEWMHQSWGSVDILVNNAGGALNTPHRLEEIRESDWDLVLDVNLKGAFLCCQTVIPHMKRQGRGTVVNMSALAGHWRASLAGVQYTAAKAGIEGLTRQLAYDWGPSGIRVNAVAPTVTFTGQRIQALWDQKTEAEQRKVLAAIPLGRIGSMAEVAAAVVFLASDASSYITGITLDVSGGRYLR